ncbi:hypothetical protein EJ110_NYTH36589 [Nymphaea thermarum]|nr:hypothetical protein EJ110_NYTH36589 [Nymphaea thermarum]
MDIIAIFQYGNYDHLALSPSFLLLKWADVETSMDLDLDLIRYGMAYWAVANTVSVCLVPDGTARVPFISPIKIREAPLIRARSPKPDQAEYQVPIEYPADAHLSSKCTLNLQRSQDDGKIFLNIDSFFNSQSAFEITLVGWVKTKPHGLGKPTYNDNKHDDKI